MQKKKKEYSLRADMYVKELCMHVREFEFILSVIDDHYKLLNKSDHHVLSLLDNLISLPNYSF